MITIKSKIFRNASWIIGCKIMQSLFSVVITALTARILAPSNYGLINYAASIVAFVVPIMQLGLNNILVMEVVNSPDDEGEIMGSSILMSLFSALLSIGGVIAFSSIANQGETETIIVCALYSLMLISQSFEMIQYWFQAKYLSKFTAITTLVSALIVSGYKVFLLVTQKSIYWFAVSHAIDYIIIAATLIVIYKKLGGKPLRFSLRRAIALFSRSKYYIVSSLMVTIFAQTGTIMLKHMVNNAATGYYSAAVTCAGLTNFVFVAIIDSFRPSVFESKKISVDAFEDKLVSLYSIVTYLALAQSIVLALFAPIITTVIYGEAYAPTAEVLRILIWYTIFSYMGPIRNIWLLAEEKQKYLWVINLLGAIANILMNLIFIPMWNIAGAALAALLTQIFTNVILGFIIKPIRRNNVLILRGLNPSNLIKLIKKVR